MSGHSKWSTIKRKKGAADAKRGVVFTKLAHAITIAAKEGGSDPGTNFALRLAMDKARVANMPTANVERSIKRGTGELGGEKPPEQVTYEAYGPGGVALLIDTLTDNRNRTVSDVRSLASKRGGSLGESGSVSYLFSTKGYVSVPKPDDTEALMLAAIEAGATDVDVSSESVEIETALESFQSVKTAIAESGYEVSSAELAKVAAINVPVADQKLADIIVNLVTDLEDLDDVVAVFTNAEIEPELVGG